jgi:Protein of unknown function (DUF1569)
MDSRLEQLHQTLATAVEGMSVEELAWHPPGKWCAAEVLEHLYLTYRGTVKGFERLMEAGKPLATRAALPHRWRTLAVVGFGYMPPGRKAPQQTIPRGLPAERVRDEIAGTIHTMDEIITKCERRFGGHIKLLDHPILGPLSATQWRKFHLVHGLHHAKQLRRLREQTKKTSAD